MLNLATRTLFRRGKDGPFLKDMPELILWSVLSVLSAVSWAYPTGILLRFSAGAIFTVLVLFQMYRSFLIIKPSKSLRRSALTDAKQRAATYPPPYPVSEIIIHHPSSVIIHLI
jgi:hypothetical protein